MVTDARGTSGLLEQLAAARVFDLSQRIHPAMPQLPGLPRFAHALVRRHGDTHRGEGYSAAQDLIVTLTHAGTHIDALGHVSVHGRLYGGRDASAVQAGASGLRELGIETVEPIVRRGVLLDVASLLEVAALEPAFGIGADLLERARAAAQVETEPGDVILVRTGWGQLWEAAPERYANVGGGLPGVDASGASWIAARRPFATGADCLMYERFEPSEDRLPVHSELIAGAGIHLIENLDLESLAAAGVHEFAFIALPLRVVGATGSQIRPIALA